MHVTFPARKILIFHSNLLTIKLNIPKYYNVSKPSKTLFYVELNNTFIFHRPETTV